VPTLLTRGAESSTRCERSGSAEEGDHLVPGDPDATRVSDVDEPGPEEGLVLVEGRLLGVCGTDRDIVLSPGYCWVSPGEDRLVIGQESLGTVLEAPTGSGFAAGDVVVGIVRRPDPGAVRTVLARRVGLLP
jgi:NADPH:quinone reductase-like Zn-dependent oxidoreductase